MPCSIITSVITFPLVIWAFFIDSWTPTNSPSAAPSLSMLPSHMPTPTPSNQPTISTMPSKLPTASPSNHPTITKLPSAEPTNHPTEKPTNSPTDKPTRDPTFTASPTKPKVKVAAYYYPWYAKNFHGGYYTRKHLKPPQYPALGEYSDRDLSVIAQHIEWTRSASISLWVASWWGPQSTEDVTLSGTIFPHLKNTGNSFLDVCLFYETKGRTKNFQHFLNVRSDAKYMATQYFGHPNYYRIDGRPVIYVYLTRVLTHEGTIGDFMTEMRAGAAEAGYDDVYIVADEAFKKPPSSPYAALGLFDAITNYNPYGALKTPGSIYSSRSKLSEYVRHMTTWRSFAHSQGTAFIPVVSPGFNHRAINSVNGGNLEPISRKIANKRTKFGSLFQAMLQESVNIIDDAADNMIVITSFNEWHEDTQIEPNTGSTPTNVDDSETGFNYTAGIEYEVYGTKYLDFVKDFVSEHNG